MTANVWEEYGPDGAVQGSYSYGYDLITQTQAGQTSYYLVDGLGSTRLLVDGQGLVLNSYGYEAFGETVSQTGTTGNKYQYAGEQLDETLGDYYLRQRFYDASSGRFGRMDTYEGQLSSPLTLNKYLYTNGNPVTGTDPTGLFSMVQLNADQAAFAILIAGVQLGKKMIYDTQAHKPEALKGFGDGYRPPTVLDSILAWRSTWEPQPREGFDVGRDMGPSHTGHPAGDIEDLAAFVFPARTYHLRKAMEADGRPVRLGHAHHVIPVGFWRRAPEAKTIFEGWGLSYEEAFNGADLSEDAHRYRGYHTIDAYDEITRRLRFANSADDARKIVRDIGKEQEAGTFTFPRRVR
jgi:RHS repeat-associated protein